MSVEYPAFLFHQGNNFKSYEFLGCHRDGNSFVFRTWAPNATAVFVVGDFNGWNEKSDPMERITDKGIWEVYIDKKINEFDNYKFLICDKSGKKHYKSDPYGVHMELRPSTASKVYDINGYKWNDEEYYKQVKNVDVYSSPINIYEVHLGSWKKYPDGNFYSYKKLAEELVPYVKNMGYTHVEFMPISEFPLDASWGYQIIGYFAPTSRFGTPKDFMYLIDKFHQNGIGVILDWVPAHFPKDEAGLSEFDGDCCYEYKNPKKGEHKGWGTKVFDYGREEVQSFLISNASYWFEKYHVDGLRIDAVSAMIYLDYGREEGEWEKNAFGGKENLEATAFIKKLNTEIFSKFPKALMIAEESTSWPMITKPIEVGGLGFNFKWNMGWMNDTIKYLNLDGLSRKYNHNLLTFSMFYAFSENYILPISHDENVYGKKSLIDKTPGDNGISYDYIRKFAENRTFFAYMFAHPGKKLLFMGTEIGQFAEWNYSSSIEWFLTDYEKHHQLQKFVKDLNNFYRENSPFWENDQDWNGFKWIVSDDNVNSVVAFERIDKNGKSIIAVFNFTPVNRENYKIGADKGKYKVIFSTDKVSYGGTGFSSKGRVKLQNEALHGRTNSLNLKIAGNSAIYIAKE
ncbi:MAG: 1,4-alpha-glucan branching protein GlgB [Clostridia bacterium]|nr:1,4-alpha-glucan branching protein GlgB [Clostridia bacterium]